eukprot:15449999-Alexandrium_andersonii.AAC.1
MCIRDSSRPGRAVSGSVAGPLAPARPFRRPMALHLCHGLAARFPPSALPATSKPTARSMFLASSRELMNTRKPMARS